MRRPLRTITVVGLACLGTALAAGACREPVGSRSDAARAPLDPVRARAVATAASDDQQFVVVQYDENATTGATVAARIMDAGAGARALQHLPYVGALATPSQIDAIATIPGVTRIWANRQLRYARATTAALLLDESIPTIKADQARAQFRVTGKGIGVAILDSGIDGAFQQDVRFPARTVQNLKIIANQRDIVCFKGAPCTSSIFVENLANSETSVGHGTHVAGIAGGDGTMSRGLYTGVAPGANLIGIGTGDILFVFWPLAGFDYILQNHDRYNIKVVNNSWGEEGEFDPDHPINVATKRVHDRGITVVFAAGNAGSGQNTLNPFSVAPWVIGVAAACSATDTFGQQEHCEGEGGTLADFSSRGVPGDRLLHPTVTAPGVHVISARASTGPVVGVIDSRHDLTSSCGLRQEFVTSYTCASGTSMSAPHVTGVVALMQQQAKGLLTPDQVKSILVKTATPIAGRATFEVGAGMVNALEAVRRSR